MNDRPLLLVMCNCYAITLQVITEIIETCRAHDFTDVILVHEHRGVPDGIIISHLPFGPTAYFGLLNVVSKYTYVTRHDIKDKKAIGTMPEAYPHLILDNFSTKVKLGTMDQDEAQTEWVIRPYMNTSKKRNFLGD
ncbi:hypothetical protein BUALT_Bualt04G0114700 [Buddleja alternifolia]|uniref:Brix domain-containing protein n=1 Tax=Buddleja alternifolia TaxID=168488 RepID=A0AAV6XUW4_9LAMI|nr:hypothetical protein BUALT_Bualt04G0114700 [Buddleja alternifolia]